MNRVSCIRQHGLSLIELMLAIAIGVVLSFGVTKLFVHSKVSALQDEQMARLQENGRYAMRYLRRELAMAGYLGAALGGERIAHEMNGTDCFDYLLDARYALEHINNVDSGGRPRTSAEAPAEGCLPGRNYVEGSDILLLRRTLDTPVIARGSEPVALAPDATFLRISGRDEQSSFEPGDRLAGTAQEILEYAPRVLFLRDYSISRGDGIPALCHRRLSRNGFRTAPVACLLEGVADLQIEFGLDDDGDRRADRYVDVARPRELQSAVTARVFLLMRSVHRVPGYSAGQSYLLGRKLVPAANDGYLRQVLQSTVLLRNSAGLKS